MAEIIFGINTCALCDTKLRDDQWIFATSSSCLPTSNRYFEYCDAGMHWDCFEKWPQRLRFARACVQFAQSQREGKPSWQRAFLGATCVVTIDFAANSENCSVQVLETSVEYEVPLERWDTWISSSVATGPEFEVLTLELAKEELRKVSLSAANLQAHVKLRSK